MEHRISEIQITPIKARDGLVAFASFVYNECLYLSSIAIITRSGGNYRLVYPTRKVLNTSFSTFHPINKEAAEYIERAVIAEFQKITDVIVRNYVTDDAGHCSAYVR